MAIFKTQNYTRFEVATYESLKKAIKKRHFIKGMGKLKLQG